MHNERFWLTIPLFVDGATYRYSVHDGSQRRADEGEIAAFALYDDYLSLTSIIREESLKNQQQATRNDDDKSTT